MDLRYDIGIIGAGPIGGYIASKLAEDIDSIAIFEQHKEIGKPVNCAGLITPRVFDSFSIPKKKIVQNEIKGAHIYAPSGKKITIGSDHVQALSIDRTAFDQYFISQAKKKNVSVFLDTKALSVQKEKNEIEVICSNTKQYSCDCVIGADGPYSKVRDLFGFPQPSEFVRGFGAIVNNISIDPFYVHIQVGCDIAPGFFAWIIPINSKGTSARIGLCVYQHQTKPPKYYFDKLFTQSPFKEILKSAQIQDKMGGIIPLGALKKTVMDNVVLVGDAAAQVKPTSGGGIYPGLVCADHCISTIKKAYKEQNYSMELLSSYHDAWKNDIGRELNLGMQFRKIFRNLTDKDFEKYIEKFKNPSLTKTITSYGDIDYPSKLVKPLLKKAPSLLRVVPKILK